MPEPDQDSDPSACMVLAVHYQCVLYRLPALARVKAAGMFSAGWRETLCEQCDPILHVSSGSGKAGLSYCA